MESHTEELLPEDPGLCVPSLKRLCLDTLIANPSLPLVSSLPDDLQEDLMRRLLFGRCLLGRLPEAGPALETHVFPLFMAGEEKGEAARLRFVAALARRFVGGLTLLQEGARVTAVTPAAARAWENERPEARVTLVEGRAMMVECKTVAAGHWQATMLSSASLLQEVALRSGGECLTVVVTDLRTEGQATRPMAVLLSQDDLRGAPRDAVTRIVRLLARAVLGSRATTCVEGHCPMCLAAEQSGVVPCAGHLAALQQVCKWDAHDWLGGMAALCPWDAHLLERVEERARDALEAFIAAKRAEKEINRD